MMLQRAPRLAAHRAQARIAGWWRRGPSRLRLRRHLGVYSIPVALLLLAVTGHLISTLMTGDDTKSAFARHDIDALRADVDTLSRLNLIDPGQVASIAGDLAVLEGRLDDAEHRFTDALTHTDNDQSCPVRVNLELVRETQGDLAANNGDPTHAEQAYNHALQAISGAPASCFQGNNDPNPDRRTTREDAAARLALKIKSLHQPPAPPPGQPQTVNPTPTSLAPTSVPMPAPPTTATPPPPPPPPPTPGNGPDGSKGGPPGGIDDISADRIPVSGNGTRPLHRLGTGGSPLDQLQTTLGDADSTGNSSEEDATTS